MVPVLQLGEAGPLHLRLKLLSDGGGGRGTKAVTSGDVYTLCRDKDFEIDSDSSESTSFLSTPGNKKATAPLALHKDR